MSNFGKRADAPSRRWLKRKRVGIPASAAVADRSAPVLIQDLSMTGARLLARDLPTDNARLTLQVGKRSLDGEIVWADGNYRGVRLDFARR
jgi:PilZ domain.